MSLHFELCNKRNKLLSNCFSQQLEKMNIKRLINCALLNSASSWLFQYSIQDNGSAKYFQGAMHTPNMGEKVAQVSRRVVKLVLWFTELQFNNLGVM